MPPELDCGRRHFLGTAAMTLAAAQLGLPSFPEANTANSKENESRELTALDRASAWLHSPPLSASSLSGKVVLVQFGTYTCINWLRTLPYVRGWARKYAQQLVIVGVHTPEFAFEKNLDNVRRSLQQMKIDFPTAIDNDYTIWRAFDNRYWPALYFIDGRGRIRHQHFGEGEYEQSETTIQKLLSEAGARVDGERVMPITATAFEVQADWRSLRSPELYLGDDRTQNFSSPGGSVAGRRHVYSSPRKLELNRWALDGEWTIGKQATVLNRAGGRIVCRFHARDVHLVMGPPRQDTPVRFRVAIDGLPPGPARGLDVDESGSGVAIDQRLYQLIRQPGSIAERTFAIEFLDAGVEAFAFTFG